MTDVNMELLVQVLNVNNGHNLELLNACPTLAEYAIFVEKVRLYQHKMSRDTTIENPLTAAIQAAIDDCIANNVLKDFLTKHRMEVVRMMNIEFNLDDAKQVWLEEQAIDIAERLIIKGWTASEAAETAGIPLATLQRYCRLATA
jgi:hypothetical protein